jgi:hypothetical protein
MKIKKLTEEVEAVALAVLLEASLSGCAQSDDLSALEALVVSHISQFQCGLMVLI